MGAFRRGRKRAVCRAASTIRKAAGPETPCYAEFLVDIVVRRAMFPPQRWASASRAQHDTGEVARYRGSGCTLENCLAQYSISCQHDAAHHFYNFLGKLDLFLVPLRSAVCQARILISLFQLVINAGVSQRLQMMGST